MKRLLSIEIQKIYHNKSARVLSLIYFVLLIPVIFILKGIFENSFQDVKLEDFGVFNFPYIWHFSTYILQWLKIFLAVVIVSLISSEYSNRTLKQNLIDGLSKKEFLTSKVLTVLLFAGISTLIVFLISLVLGLSYSDFTEASTIVTDIDFLFAYFVRLSAFFSLCLFMGFLMKRSAFALGVLLVYWIVENLLVLGLSYLLYTSGIKAGFNSIKAYFPLGSMETLIGEPFTRLRAISSAGKQVGFDISEKFNGVQYGQILICLIYISVFIWLSYVLLKKRDL